MFDQRSVLRTALAVCLAMVAAGVLAASASASYTVYVGAAGGNVIPLATNNHDVGFPMPIHVSPQCEHNRSGGQSHDPLTALAINPSGTTAYVTNGCDDLVAPLSLTSSTYQKTIPVGSDPVALAITPDGSTAYVVNSGDDTVTPIALASHTPGPAIRVGSQPSAIAITPNGATAYVVNSGDGTVTPIALATNTPGPPIDVARPLDKRNLSAIAITPNAQTAYVTDYHAGEVIPIALATNTPGAPIPVGPYPTAIAITPDGTMAYVVEQAGVTPITLSTGTAGSPLAVTGNAIAITPDGQQAYVPQNNMVSVINLSTNSLSGTDLPRYEDGVAVAVSPIVLRDTSTSVSCSPNPLAYHVTAMCTATVTDTDAGTPVTPTGPIRFDATVNRGSFSPRTCSLAGSGASASCSVDYSQGYPPPYQVITAIYNGDALHSLSSDTTNLQLEADPTKTTLGCAQTTLAVGQSTTCTATVTNLVGVQFIDRGEVVFSGLGDDHFAPASCALTSFGPTATCDTTYTPTGDVGPHTITAQTQFSYGQYDQPSSGSLQIDVQPSP